MSTISSQEIISIIKGEIEDYDAHAGQINETGSVSPLSMALITPCTERSLYLKTVSRVWSRTSVKMRSAVSFLEKIQASQKGQRLPEQRKEPEFR